ncbi:hypothetical protein B0H10DRAFT_2446572 [Mycena sp. CBHHK59/15]|nr:hypothetical protein B0H10DRAFT_2446572 [Mycena sp. CBHHK59/15]
MEYALPPPPQRNTKKSRPGRRRNVSAPSLHIHHAKPFHEQRGCAHSSVTLRPLPCGDSPCHTHDYAQLPLTPLSNLLSGTLRDRTTSDVHDDVHDDVHTELSAASLSRTPRTRSTTHALHISDVRHGPSPQWCMKRALDVYDHQQLLHEPIASIAWQHPSLASTPHNTREVDTTSRHILRAARDDVHAEASASSPSCTPRAPSAGPPAHTHPTYLLPRVTHEDTPWTSPRLPSKRAILHTAGHDRSTVMRRKARCGRSRTAPPPPTSHHPPPAACLASNLHTLTHGLRHLPLPSCE